MQSRTKYQALLFCSYFGYLVCALSLWTGADRWHRFKNCQCVQQCNQPAQHVCVYASESAKFRSQVEYHLIFLFTSTWRKLWNLFSYGHNIYSLCSKFGVLFILTTLRYCLRSVHECAFNGNSVGRTLQYKLALEKLLPGKQTLQHAQTSEWAKKPRVLERGSSGKADDWRKRWIHWQDLVRMYSSLQYKGGPERDSLFWTRSDISNNLVILQDVLDLELHPQLWQELTTKHIGLGMNSQFPSDLQLHRTTDVALVRCCMLNVQQPETSCWMD